jgi:hypothetical protein
MKLNNQEIRNCIYAGSFNNLLRELNKNPAWMKINKMKKAEGYRFTKQELILRLFAFHDNYRSYGGRLAKFLNEYMEANKDLNLVSLDSKRMIFTRTIDIVIKKVFEGKVPSNLTISVLESLLVGVSLNLNYLESQTILAIKTMFNNLQRDNEFSEAKLREGLSGKQRVIGRLSIAERVFAGN